MKMFLAKEKKNNLVNMNLQQKKEPKWTMPSLLLKHSIGSYSRDTKNQQMENLAPYKSKEQYFLLFLT